MVQVLGHLRQVDPELGADHGLTQLTNATIMAVPSGFTGLIS
jgi:hypothetical protein